MRLSVLICSHPERKPLLDRMVSHLESQKQAGVEIVYEFNSDYLSRGITRNKLLDRAKGQYCCFVDDDDVVSDDYIEQILKALEFEPDICGITGRVISLLTNEAHDFVLSTKHEKPFSLPSRELSDGRYLRSVSHLNPIKTEIARKIRFPESKIRHEDNDYTQRLKHLRCKLKEVFIDDVIYYYFNKVAIT